MMDSLLKRIEKNRKAHIRWLAMVLCLSMIVSLGTFAGFRQTAVAKTYTKEVLDCPFAQEGASPVAHVHNDDCYDGDTLVCTLPEREAHTHTEECFAEQRRLTCVLEENPGHQHGDACYAAREENVCGLEENPGHVHNGTCFNDSGVLICTMAEGDGAHTHTADCFTTVYDLICDIPEGEGAHTHTDECYTTERVQVCGQEELPVHVHGPECIRTVEWNEGEDEPVVTDEPAESTIPEMPVSDPDADLETAEDWNREFENFELSGNWARDLVLVAATQQGRGESPNNFEAVLNDAGDAWVRHGYTRYGAWYGVPYAEEWSAMFVSFCLRYAGIPVENVPNNPTAALMAESFSKGELFAGRDYVPAVGDLIFFDTIDDEITTINHMGIVYHVDTENGTINTVEGDRTESVATFGYTLDDEQIVGYGILPQNPDYIPTEENNGDETDGLIVMTEDTQKKEETTDTIEETAPTALMPAQSWERTAGGIKVTVDAPEGAFPENTTIAVTPVNGNSLKDTVSDAVSGEVLEVQAVDITFFDADGHEIEPAVPIRVVMTPAATEHAEEKTSVVHVDIAQQTAELVEQAAGTELDNSEVVFDADAFTIYAIVYTVDTYFRSCTGETFRVTMDFDENAGIPQNAELVVEEILEESADYSDLLSQTENTLDGNKQISFVRFFDISIMADGEEVQPLAPVSMKIQLADLPEETNAADAQVIHFGEQPEVLTTEAAGANVSFETSSFSVYGVVYTVDFEHEVDGTVYQFSIPGGNIITLSDLVELLGIIGSTNFSTVDEFMASVENVEFSDPALVKVVHPEEDTTVGEIVRSLGVERQLSATIGEEEAEAIEEKIIHKNEWTLISVKPFDTNESLTITMKNGDVFTVKVTDASSVIPNDGIKSLLTDVTITGASQGANGYIFYPDQPYGISLSFKEVNKDNGQFPMEGSFTYQLPAGLVPSGESTSNFLEIELSGGDHSGEKVKLNYTIDSNGLITFNWDTTTNPGAYSQLADALYSQFKMNIQCTYTGDSGTLNFGNGITKDVEIRTNGKINTPGKNAKYNPVTNCVDYTVTVYSDGVTKNVVITDTVSGSALTYKNDAVATTTVNGKSIPQPSTLSGGNGFTMTVPQMNDGETITVKYSAEIDLSKVTKNSDGSWGTVDETGNKVVVKSKDNPDVEKENSGKDFEHKIFMANIDKTGTNVEADENGHATVNWTIRANDNANVSMGGHYIKDTIDNGSNMTYNSLGIHVVAYNADGSQNYEKDIRWGENGLAKTADDKSWTWNIPNQEPDSQKLSYVITYTTDADVSGRLVNTQVKNKSESDLGGPSEGSASITPHGGALSAHKKVVKTDVTNKTVTWEINFDVPATGLNSAQIIDTMPAFWENDQVKYSDSYLGNSTITITPELAAGESYEATASADGKTLTIDFYKTEEEQKVTGLSATGSARKIRVQFQTEFNEDWLTAAEGHQNETNYTNHTNTGRVLLNGQTIGVSATTKVESNEPGMSKVHEAQTKFTANGDELPAFPYTIKLVGVNEDSFDDQGKLIIEDTFNSKYLTYYDYDEGNHNGQNDNNGYVYGSIPGTNVNDRTTKGPKVVELDGTGKIKITIDRDTIPMQTEGLGESFYPFYLIHYYLTVKDPIALEKLEREIQNSESGSYPLLNTATNAVFGTTSTTVDFDIDVLDKQKGAAYNSNGNWVVDFTLNVNPDALPLGDEEELTLTDDYTNLSVDYTTIKIQKEVDGQLVDTTSADGVSWNRKGNRITYTLQNGVHYIITYTAKITGEPEGDGKVHFNNTAEYFGVKKWSNGDQNISSSGSGSSATYGIQLLKHEKGAGSSPLQGAKFKLYKFEATQEQDDGWKTQPSNAINTVTRTPEDSGWSLARTTELVTGSDGVAKTSSTDRIQPMTWYMLIETEAPVYGEGSEHYQLKDFGYVFWITNNGAADYSHYVYLNDDVVAIDNEPPIPETVDIGVTKTWAGDTEDTSKRKDITVRLYADGVPYDDWTDKDGHHMPVREPNDTVKVLHLNADGTTDPYVWNDLPGGPVYSVREDGVAGYTTTYSPKGTQVSGTLGIRNKYIPGKTFIHVEKNWSGMTQDGQAEDITVHLKRKLSANVPVVIRGNDNGRLGGTVWNTSIAAGSGFSLTYSWKNNWGTKDIYYYIYNRETGELIKSGVHPFSGTGEATIEIAATDVPSGGIDIRLADPYYNNWDQFISNYSIVEFKENPGAGGGTYIDDVNFNNENRYYTISAANGWKIDIDRLVKEDDDGKYIYYIEEVGVNDNTETPEEAGYTVTYENNKGIVGGTGNAAQDTIKVINSPEPGSLEVTKTVSGTDAKSTYSIAVKDSNGHYYALDGTDKGTEAFYVSFSKDSTQKWNNLPAGTYTVEEQDANVTGYTWHVTGTGNVEVPVGGTAEAEVTNIYEEKPVSGSLTITKAVNPESDANRAANKTFTFEVILRNDDNTAYTGVVKVQDKTRSTETAVTVGTTGKITVTVTGTGTATISEIPVGTQYVVTEPEEEMPAGWSKDGIVYGDTTQTIAGGDNDTATVTNKYEATGAASFKGTKTIEKRYFKEGDSFTVKVVGVDNAPMPGETAAGAEYIKKFTLTAEQAAEHATSFTYALDEISYSLSDIPAGETSKNFTYTVTESAQKMDGVAQVDSTQHTVTVTISDKGDGTLNVVKSTNSENLNFTNTYDTSTKISIPGTKELTGKTPENEAFSFNIEAVTVGAPMPADTTVTNTGTEFSFGPITYTLTDYNKKTDHQFVYKITEDQTGVNSTAHVKDNILYDQSEIEVTVTLSYDESTGDLSASVNKDAATIKFTNTPQTTSVEVDKKWLLGTDVTSTIQNASLKLTLSAEGWDGKNADGDTVTTEVALPNGTGDDRWNTKWTNLPKYNASGELYTYVVTESDVKVAGDALIPAAPVTVMDGKAIITNNLPTTSVKVTKTWDKGEIPDGTEVEITISATGTTESITTLLAQSDINSGTVILKKNDAEKTWTNLPVYDSTGAKITYSVTETKVKTPYGEWTTTSTPSITDVFDVTGGTLTNGETTFDNTPLTGKLDVTKELKYNGTADTTTTQDFYAAVFSGDNRVTDVKKISVSNGSGTTSFTGLKAGVAYTLKETDAVGIPVGDGFEYAVSYENQNFTLKRGELEKTAKIINDKSEKGQLTVNKKVMYNDAVDTEAGTTSEPMEFTVAIFTKDGETYTQVGEAKIIKVVEGETTEPAVFNELDIGTTYYVFEMNGETRVDDLFGSYTVRGSGANFTPTREEKNGTKEIVNAQSETGSLKVTKLVQKNGTNSVMAEEASFTIGLFRVSVADVDGSTVQNETLEETKEIKISAGSSSNEVTFDKLTIGTKYRVYEMNGKEKVAGEAHLGEYTVTYDNNQTIEITRSEKDSGATTVTNNKETTSLKAKKDWTPESLLEGTSVEVTIKATVMGDGTEHVDVTNSITEIGYITKTITGEGTVEWTDLPKYYNGKEVTYSVAETKVIIGGTAVWNASAENGETNPFLTNTNTINKETTFTNDYTDLYVQKRFTLNSMGIDNWQKELDLGPIYFKLWKADPDAVNDGFYVNENGGKEDKVFELQYSNTVSSPGEYKEGDTVYVRTGEDLHYAKHFANLPAGNYSVHECDKDGDHVLTAENNAYMTCTEMDGKLQVMKNIVTSVTAAKHWDDKDTTVTTHPDVTFKLQKKVGEEGNWTTVSTLVLSQSNPTAEGHQYNEPGTATDGTILTDPYVEWNNLPVWDINAGVAISYRTVEVQPGDIKGYSPSGTVADDGNVYGADDGKHETFTNELETIEIEVTKKWEPGVPDNAEITLTLTSRADSTFSIVVKLNGKSDWPDDATGVELETGTWETYTASGNSANAHEVTPGWVARWSDLPKYTFNSEGTATEITYAVTETGTQTGFTPYYGDSATSVTLTDNTEDTQKTGELTNTQKIDLILEKVDRNNPATKLKDAEFKLEKLVATNVTTVEVDSNFTAVTKTTGADGTMKFEDLKAGYYRITETQAPAGYVYTDKSTAYIKVDGNGVTLLKAESGKAPNKWGSLSGDEYLNFTNVSNTLTVGNDAGSQLPQTGGIGTTLFTALGGLMTATAGAILTMKSYRRRKQNA